MRRLAAIALTALLAAPLVARVAPAAGTAGWSTVAPMPTGRYGPAVATLAGRVYAVSGTRAYPPSYNTTVVEAYDPSTNTWSTPAPLPVNQYRTSAAAAVSGGKLYVFGGNGTVGFTNSVLAYDPVSNSWSVKASMSYKRYGHAAVTAPDGRIYVIGGHGMLASEGTSYNLAAVERYDPTTNTWATVASLPQARAWLAAALGPDGRVYAIAGAVTNQSASNRVATVDAYDPVADSWSSRTPIPPARVQHAAATGPDGRIYVLGGYGASRLASVEAYDVYAGTWSAVAPMPTARDTLGAATGPDGRVYAVGGYALPTYYLSTVEAYQTGAAAAAQSLQVTGGAGTLAVSLQNSSVPFGTVPPAGDSGPIGAGWIRSTNTLNDGSAWSVTVAATSLVSTGHTALSFTGLVFTPGVTISGVGETAGGVPSAGSSGAFSGDDTTPGITYSSPRTVASAAVGVAGTFEQAGTTVSLHAPVTAQPGGPYTGTLQYTITG